MLSNTHLPSLPLSLPPSLPPSLPHSPPSLLPFVHFNSTSAVNNSTLPVTSSSTTTQRVIPGAIQHSVLEASLFGNSSWSNNFYPYHGYLSYNTTGQQSTETGITRNTGSVNRSGQVQQHQQQQLPQQTGLGSTSYPAYMPSILPWTGLCGIGVSATVPQQQRQQAQEHLIEGQIRLQPAQNRSMRLN